MMATRTGNIDAAAVLAIKHQLSIDDTEVRQLLNSRGGFLGVSGLSNDLRTLLVHEQQNNYRAKLADRPDLLEKLLPDYPVFGKRIVMDIDWLQTLCRDNVSLETTGVERVEAVDVAQLDRTGAPLPGRGAGRSA